MPFRAFTRSERTRPAPGRLLPLALCVIAWAACGDPVEARYQAQLDANLVQFGDDGRVAVQVQPGRPTFDGDEAALAVRVRSSVPWPALTVSNGTTDPQEIEVTLQNVDVDADWSAVLGAIAADARRDPQCTQAPFSTRQDVVVAPPEVRALDPTTARLRIGLEACTSLSLESALASSVGAVRLVVVGPADGDMAWLGRALNAAVALEPDVVVSLGSVRAGGGGFSAAADRFAATGTPRVVVFGRGDRRAPEGFRATFGQTDYAWSLGSVSALVLDTADARLSEPQFELIQSVAPLGAGWFATDTFPMGADPDDGFRSQPQAMRVIEGLRVAEITHAFAAADARTQSATFAGIELRRLLGGRRSQDNGVWVLEVADPWGTPTLSVERVPF